MILNFFVFFTVYYLSFLSIYSYGKYFRLIFFKYANNDVNFNNEFANFFFGIAFFIIFSWLYNFSFGLKNEWINLFIILLGIIFFILDKNKINNKIFYFFPVVLYLGIIVYNNHNDFYLYHFQNIIELIDNNPKIGIGNLNSKYVYASLFTYFESLFHFPIYKYEFINIPRYLVFLSICGYLLLNVLEKNNKFNQFLSAVLLIFFLLKFKRFSEHGYDYIAIFFVIFIFLEFFYNHQKKIYHFKSIIFFFSILICIKVTGLFFLPFIIYAIYKNFLINISVSSWLKNLIPTYIVIFIFLMNSFLNSGCIFYPVKFTCFNQNTISWSVNYNYIDQESNVAKKWAKGFYHQHSSNKISNYYEYSKNGKWIFSWFQSHFMKKIFEPLLIFICIFLIYYFLSRINQKKKKNNLTIFFLSLTSLILWLFSLPQLRFGFSYVLISTFLTFSFFLKKECVVNQKCKVFILLAIIFFNFHNIKRISNEFSRNTHFPFYKILSYKANLNKINNLYYYKYTGDFDNFKIVNKNEKLSLKYNLLFLNDNLNIFKKYNFVIFEQRN